MAKEIKIAICGKIRSGKDTVSEYLQEKYHMFPFAFADEMKNGFHYTYPHIKRNPKPRRGYQLFAELMRYVNGGSYWINLCFEKVDYIRKTALAYNTTGEESPFNPLITDLRLNEEFDALREEGYTIIRVNASLETRLARANAAGDIYDEQDLQDVTEMQLDSFDVDFDISNDGTLNGLYAQVDAIMSVLNK